MRAFIIIFLCCFTTLAFSSPAPQSEGRVLVGIDPQRVGDQNQVLGIAAALSRPYIETPLTDEGAWATLQGKDLVVLSGQGGLERLAKLPPGGTVVWSGHQLFAELVSLKRYPDLVFLPAHAVMGRELPAWLNKERLVVLTGVPHRITAAGVRAALQNFSATHGALSADPKPKRVGVILPGDAPDEHGMMRFFTPVEARLLARHLVHHEGRTAHYLVTNGPRTGSHDYETKMKLSADPHRSGMVDGVSAAFMAELTALGVTKATLFDFQFATLPSAYQPMLGLMLEGGSLHIAGESTSMVSEASDLLGCITIDMVASMNTTHTAHAQALYEQGQANLLGVDGGLQKASCALAGATKGGLAKVARPLPAEMAAQATLRLWSKAI